MVKAEANRLSDHIGVSLELSGTAIEMHKEFRAIVKAFTQAMLNKCDEGKEMHLVLLLGSDLLDATKGALEAYLDLKKQEVDDG